LGERLDRAAREDLRRRSHVERVSALDRQSCRTCDAHHDVGRSRCTRRQRHGHAVALLGGELERLRGGAPDHVETFAPDLDLVVAGRALDIVEVETHGAAIAVEKKTRQRRSEHQRIANGDIAARSPDLVLRPGDRHHPCGAGKIRDIECHLSGAIGLDRDNAGVERQRLLRRRRAL